VIATCSHRFFGIGGWHGFICAIDLLTGFACVVFYFLKKRQALAAAQANNGAGLASQVRKRPRCYAHRTLPDPDCRCFVVLRCTALHCTVCFMVLRMVLRWWLTTTNGAYV